MGTIDRVIMSIYMLALTVLSFGIILLSFKLISLEVMWTSISGLYGHWEAGLVGLILFLINVRLLLAGLRSRKGKRAVVHHTEMGDVHISLDAVENLVEKVTRNIRGVRGVKVAVRNSNSGLKIHIKAVVSPESNVPNVTAETQERVRSYIKNTVGIEPADVNILVENISNEFKSKQRVQ